MEIDVLLMLKTVYLRLKYIPDVIKIRLFKIVNILPDVIKTRTM